jgi:hypothetical protein
MSNQKGEKPVLQGQRIKTRKRDEKEKYDPSAFRDAIIQGFNDAKDPNEECYDLDQVSKFLDSAGSKLDYRRYGEVVLDVVFAGGILAPGGFILEDGDGVKPVRTECCVFRANAEPKSLKKYYEVLYKLIRRYKYMEKPLEEELRKLIMFLKGFSGEERQKLATTMGICLANGLGKPTCLDALFEEHLVKEGLALDFATDLFKAWLAEKDMSNLGSALKRAGLETKLLDLLPFNKRSTENFDNHFREEGLEAIVEYQRVKASGENRKNVLKKLSEMVKDEEPVKDVIQYLSEEIKKNGLAEHEAVVMVWSVLMSVVEWNKKEELVAEQALKHLRTNQSLLAAFATSERSELQLIVKVQEYCYTNMAFLNNFQKIILTFYKAEVLSEETILKWYREAHSQKGKGVFLGQMKKFVEWLENAEEESEDEEEGEEED